MPREWYFIRRLRDHERPWSSKRVEVQVLDDDGLAVDVGYSDEDAQELIIGSVSIPLPVLQAAKGKRVGEGDYVGPHGESLPPF